MLLVTTHSGKREPCRAPTQAARPQGASPEEKAVWLPVCVGSKPCAALRGDCEQESDDNKGQMPHQRTRTGKKKHACSWEGCGRAFGQTSDLKKHWRTHTGEKPFVCSWEGCGKPFARSDNLRQHLWGHSAKKTFVCPQEGCGYACVQSIQLQQHVRVHTGEKPFVCRYVGCGRAFASSSHLIRHRYVHSGQRNFVCPRESCDYACIQSSDLKRHLRVHSGAKPVVCSHEGCGRVFTQSSHLTQHLRVHSGEKPFACSWKGCGRAFARFESLKRHWYIHPEGKNRHPEGKNRHPEGKNRHPEGKNRHPEGKDRHPEGKNRVDLKEASTNMSEPSAGSCEGQLSGRDRAGCSRRLAVGKGPTSIPMQPEPGWPVHNAPSYPSCIAAGAGPGVPVDAGPAADQDHQSTGVGHDSPCFTTAVLSAGQQRPGSTAMPDEEQQLSQWGDWPSSSLLPSLECAGLESMVAPDVDMSDWLTGWAADNPSSPFCAQLGTDACDPDAAVLSLSDDDKAFWQELISLPDSDTWRAAF